MKKLIVVAIAMLISASSILAGCEYSPASVSGQPTEAIVTPTPTPTPEPTPEPIVYDTDALLKTAEAGVIGAADTRIFAAGAGWVVDIALLRPQWDTSESYAMVIGEVESPEGMIGHVTVEVRFGGKLRLKAKANMKGGIGEIFELKPSSMRRPEQDEEIKVNVFYEDGEQALTSVESPPKITAQEALKAAVLAHPAEFDEALSDAMKPVIVYPVGEAGEWRVRIWKDMAKYEHTTVRIDSNGEPIIDEI
ncbi:MAG: hypothetical protein ACOYJD_08560 [Christensenellales bacterium]